MTLISGVRTILYHSMRPETVANFALNRVSDTKKRRVEYYALGARHDQYIKWYLQHFGNMYAIQLTTDSNAVEPPLITLYRPQVAHHYVVSTLWLHISDLDL